MSVLDKWLNIHRRNLGSATSATSATTPNSSCNLNGLDVAGPLLHFATSAPETPVSATEERSVREEGNHSETSAEIERAAQDWRDMYEERAAHRQYDGGYTRAEAEQLAWGEMQNRWHLKHDVGTPRDICAGCRKPIGAAMALDLINGSRVHLDDENACLVLYGDRWRAAATRGLLALGLRPPEYAE